MLNQYTFKCEVDGVACGNLSVTVVARDTLSAINEMLKLLDVASYELVKIKKINMASPAQAGSIKKIL